MSSGARDGMCEYTRGEAEGWGGVACAYDGRFLQHNLVRRGYRENLCLTGAQCHM